VMMAIVVILVMLKAVAFEPAIMGPMIPITVIPIAVVVVASNAYSWSRNCKG
jgi:hypothetical protein